jgi:hypothetical protein
MQHTLLREMQGGLDVLPSQLGIARQDLIPGFAFRKLAQDDLHRDAGAPDDGPTAANARVDLNALVHAGHFPITPTAFQFANHSRPS